jgi:plasmid stabilization system protein ParE
VGLSITLTPLATQQVRAEGLWWRRNRTRAPGLFRKELRSAFELITEYPEAGAIAEDVELPEVRRVLLAATQHYLYYRVYETLNRIEVLSVWSTHRGDTPRM